MRLIFLGTPELAVPALRSLASHADFRPTLVFTQPPARRSRRGEAEPTPVAQAAGSLGIEYHAVPDINAAEPLQRMREAKPDAIIVVAFGQFLKRAVLELPRHGCLNFHPSLLPRYRGAAPVQRAVIDGVAESGLSIIRLVRKMDAGPILLQRPWHLDPDKNAAEFLAEAGEAGAGLLLEALRGIGSLEPAAQDDALATFAPPLKKADGEIHFNRPARELHNLVRGVQPWPRAEALLLRDKPVRMLVHRSQPLDERGEPGRVLCVDASGIVVACSAGALCLREVQLEGKPARAARDVANGLRLAAGEQFRI